jgi:hypothetical protein
MARHSNGFKIKNARGFGWEVSNQSECKNRHDTIYVALSIEETKEMSDWCIYLGDTFPEAVQSIKQIPLKNIFAFGIISKFVTKSAPDKFPKKACEYLNAILKAEEWPHLTDELRTLHSKFKATIAQTQEFKEFEELLYLRGWSK